MKKSLLSFILVVFCGSMFSQTTHQVCVTGVSATGGNACVHTAIFTPAHLTINVGDKIQFTTFMVALTGYNGNHDIQFSGSSANNVLLPISTNVLSQVTTVITPAFNTPGTFPMECKNNNHCMIADLMEGWSCTAYSVTVGTVTEIEEERLKHTVNAYPNPSTGIINVNLLPIKDENPKVYLIDILGKTIKTYENINSSSLLIDASNFEKGTYFIKVVSDNNNYDIPVVLQ